MQVLLSLMWQFSWYKCAEIIVEASTALFVCTESWSHSMISEHTWSFQVVLFVSAGCSESLLHRLLCCCVRFPTIQFITRMTSGVMFLIIVSAMQICGCIGSPQGMCVKTETVY